MAARVIKRRPRILLGPVEIAGYYTALDAGLRDLGLNSRAVDLGPHPFGYRTGPGDDPMVVRLVRLVRDQRPKPGAPIVLQLLWRAAWATSRVLLLVWALRFDIFVFSAGVTLLRGFDLPLLKLLGKRVIVVFHGSDARPAYIDGQLMTPTRAVSIPACIAFARRQKSRIRRIERYADVVVAQPAFSHFFERPVVNWFAIGVPWRAPPNSTAGERTHHAPIRILHSPSDPEVKGSRRIREAVEQLKAEGLSLELVELRGVPNDVVLDEVAKCDFAIDQLYSDAPMVGFATEAAVASRPTIVAGYAWAANRAAFGTVPFPPVEECTPEGLVDAIRRLATDADHRAALGREAHAFVRDQWSREQIARRMLALMQGPAPSEWMFDPRSLTYVEGCGLTRQQAQDVVRAVLDEGGRGALCLSDKPQLEAAFIAFAAGGPISQIAAEG